MNPRRIAQILWMLLSQGIAFAVSPLVTDDADTVEPGKLQLNWISSLSGRAQPRCI